MWHGNSALEIVGAHHVTVLRSRIYGDYPYWVFWSDMKDSPLPADRLRGTSIDLSAGAHDVEIAYSHVRGSGNDLIGTKDDESNLFVHHCRIENAGDDAFEIEGTTNVGRVEIYENYILNALVAIAPGQSTPSFTGPLLVYRNVVALLRNPPVNRAPGINGWNGGYRYGFEYLFKHGAQAADASRNAHYYHNTLVLLNSNDHGMNITPTDPSNSRIANNIEFVVNGPVNRNFRSGRATVSGLVDIVVSAADDSGLVSLELSMDETLVATSGSGALTYAWDTTLGADGAHLWMARARDTAGQESVDPISLTVRNDATPPGVFITAPVAGSTVSGQVTVHAEASDAAGVSGIELYLDGAMVGASASATIDYAWDTEHTANGIHQVVAHAS